VSAFSPSRANGPEVRDPWPKHAGWRGGICRTNGTRDTAGGGPPGNVPGVTSRSAGLPHWTCQMATASTSTTLIASFPLGDGGADLPSRNWSKSDWSGLQTPTASCHEAWCLPRNVRRYPANPGDVVGRGADKCCGGLFAGAPDPDRSISFIRADGVARRQRPDRRHLTVVSLVRGFVLRRLFEAIRTCR